MVKNTETVSAVFSKGDNSLDSGRETPIMWQNYTRMIYSLVSGVIWDGRGQFITKEKQYFMGNSLHLVKKRLSDMPLTQLHSEWPKL